MISLNTCGQNGKHDGTGPHTALPRIMTSSLLRVNRGQRRRPRSSCRPAARGAPRRRPARGSGTRACVRESPGVFERGCLEDCSCTAGPAVDRGAHRTRGALPRNEPLAGCARRACRETFVDPKHPSRLPIARHATAPTPTGLYGRLGQNLVGAPQFCTFKTPCAHTALPARPRATPAAPTGGGTSRGIGAAIRAVRVRSSGRTRRLRRAPRARKSDAPDHQSEPNFPSRADRGVLATRCAM